MQAQYRVLSGLLCSSQKLLNSRLSATQALTGKLGTRGHFLFTKKLLASFFPVTVCVHGYPLLMNWDSWVGAGCLMVPVLKPRVTARQAREAYFLPNEAMNVHQVVANDPVQGSTVLKEAVYVGSLGAWKARSLCCSIR